MSFIDAIKSFFKNYTNFNIRARRSEYWFATLFLFLGYFAAACLDTMGGAGFVTGFFMLATIFPALAVLVRRLHDSGRSGLWVLLGFLPVANLVLLVFVCQDSVSANQWGTSEKTV